MDKQVNRKTDISAVSHTSTQMRTGRTKKIAKFTIGTCLSRLNMKTLVLVLIWLRFSSVGKEGEDSRDSNVIYESSSISLLLFFC